MRLSNRGIVAFVVMGCALPVVAAEDHTFTGNVSLSSNYIFRGLTQTNEKPAIQGGFDYSHSSGLYAGVWGSNVSWFSDSFAGNSNSIELDFYGGYRPTFNDFFADIGILRYEYPGSYSALPTGVVEPNTTEVYLAGGWKTISLKYSHSLDDTFGVCDAKGTYYLDLTGSWPIGDFSILGHIGRQKFKGSCNGGDNNVGTYKDWKIEGAWSFAKDWTLAAGYTDTDAGDRIATKALYTPATTNNFLGDGMGYIYLKKVF